MSSLAKLYNAAGGRCTYCGCETYQPGRARRAAEMVRFGILPDAPPCSRKALRYREATREHIVRRAEGGGSHIENLALACKFCNVTRGELSPEAFRSAVSDAIVSGLHPNHSTFVGFGVLSAGEMRRQRKRAGLSFFAAEARP